MHLILIDPLTIPACLSTGRAGLSQWRPCPLWKHWDLPSLGIQNTKVVYLRHMDSNATKRVLLCDTGEVLVHIWSSDLLRLPPSMRRSVKPWGECWNHYQGAKKLEVELTPRKIRCLRADRARPFRALALTYRLHSVVDTSNSAWTQANSE